MKRINWAIEDNKDIIETALNRYRRFLKGAGRRPSTTSSYIFHVEMYLTFARTYRPSEKILQAYREQIFDQHWARSTLNNSAFATTAYHEMLGEKVKIRSFQKREAPRLFYRA